MLFLCFIVASLAVANAWVPPPRPLCNTVNVRGGSVLLPHEKFCNLFYMCDLEGNQQTMYCPDKMLFSYGPGHAVCVNMGYSNSTCPNWACDTEADRGKTYPAPCCDEYWECVTPGVNKKFERRVCNAALGESYDVNLDRCSVNAVCDANQQLSCPKTFRAGSSNVCPHSAASDPCMYRTVGWVDDRKCPGGTSFNAATCGCNDFNAGCAPSGLSVEDMLVHKSAQANQQCQPTGRLQWNANNIKKPITVRSDRLNKDVDHYFQRPTTGFAIQADGLQAIFSGSAQSDSFIYDYFYNDNVLYAPTAFRMVVRFNNPRSTLTFNREIILLENRYDPNTANTHCIPSLVIKAQYGGLTLGQLSYTFTVTMRGQSGLTSTMQAQVVGQDNDYFQINVFFGQVSNAPGNVQSGSVVNFGSTNQLAGQTVQFQSDNRNLGANLARVKCGFAICRNFDGALRTFNVYEGCGNFNNIV